MTYIEHRGPYGTREWVASVGVEVQGPAHGFCHLWGRHHSRQGEPVTDAFSHRHCV